MNNAQISSLEQLIALKEYATQSVTTKHFLKLNRHCFTKNKRYCKTLVLISKQVQKQLLHTFNEVYDKNIKPIPIILSNDLYFIGYPTNSSVQGCYHKGEESHCISLNIDSVYRKNFSLQPILHTLAHELAHHLHQTALTEIEIIDILVSHNILIDANIDFYDAHGKVFHSLFNILLEYVKILSIYNKSIYNLN